MTFFTRYAIYYLPEPGPLADFGARWLGWDVQAGTPAAPTETDLPLEQLTATPRKYGFHATIKPPFRLPPGTTPEALAETARALCAALAPVTLEGLCPTLLGRFLALTPEGDTAALSALASEVVRDLDAFRAPATEAELEKRRKARLSPRQDQLLTRWGYPYVLEEFRFHMTLTGRLTPGQAGATAAALADLLKNVPLRPLEIRDLCLCGEDAEGRFHLVERLPLGQGNRP
ncbi:DUF1045 domain-containing protein [Pseudooceanicola sp. CBS1P-1]|uniref:DUF1045 domain-containing protein n=1 Tax=Pseudooceanicola albus TaxID=2692189 RepID=A0A6L7G4J9_9RHOB|nr:MULTISPECIES: DUF1045 domain-containing protein [Pseudooceanicola]MBT9385543.1 DUF1045 domain-containing protein [Pseudooceanicola endophyticus]MXN19045.1 DUF1045 domain-containing protein [Pseudooceanicola albus]